MKSKSLAEIIAALLTKQTMIEAATDEREDKIELVKRPGFKGADMMEVHIHFESPMHRILMYVTNIVEAAACSTNVSFENMLSHIKTCHELMQAVLDEQIESTSEDVKDED